MKKIVISHDGDGRFDVFLFPENGDCILVDSYNHDKDGWHGMHAIEELIDYISIHFNIPVEEQYK